MRPAPPSPAAGPNPCVVQAWDQHEAELRAWLHRQLRGDAALAQDILQSIFLRSLRQGARFCEVRQPRAWLFTTARNLLTDHHRSQRDHLPLPDQPAPDPEPPPPVDALSQCLPRALAELDPKDADILRQCDLGGVTQASYARQHGLSLPGAKSRLQRARRRLADHLRRACQVRVDEDGQVCCFTPRPPAPSSSPGPR